MMRRFPIRVHAAFHAGTGTAARTRRPTRRSLQARVTLPAIATIVAACTAVVTPLHATAQNPPGAPNPPNAPNTPAAPNTPEAQAAPSLTVEEYRPRSTLRVPATTVTRARFPFIDVHSHQRPRTQEQIDQLVREMDELNMAVLVDLSGGTGERLAQKVAAYRERYASRFVVFANVDFTGIDEPGWSERAARQLEQDVRVHGAGGLKIFKNLGMDLHDRDGRVRTDDPRLDAIWAKAGELGVPVLIHTAEPASFFEPHDATNERWLELKLHPGRARPPDRYPSWETLMQEQWNVFRRHPQTTFISAHMSWLANDLDRLGQLLDEMPNMVVELGAVIAEIGRQPRHAARFFARYRDRVLLGKDSYRPEEYHTYFRVLETADEYFDYYRDYHAFWRMYGLDLPDDVLRAIYYDNARRLLPPDQAPDFSSGSSGHDSAPVSAVPASGAGR
jgi:uncharacterized protein